MVAEDKQIKRLFDVVTYCKPPWFCGDKVEVDFGAFVDVSGLDYQRGLRGGVKPMSFRQFDGTVEIRRMALTKDVMPPWPSL